MMKDKFPTNERTYFAHLSVDGSAPTEYGGGLIFERSKISEQETVPTKFHFWYTVVDKNLQHGWECRDPEDKSTAKKIEIAERHKRVKQLLAEGMKQKDIASHSDIGVNAATISRDVAAIEADEQRQKSRAKLLAQLSPNAEYEDDEGNDEDESDDSTTSYSSPSSEPKKHTEDDAW
jgi:uncharacterized protein YerC